ncbi:MAG: hypothetical protein Q9P01_11625, partial [Anaerolineae bacterium]|nr:hypothetical protein [Anaerolineae bacterium]
MMAETLHPDAIAAISTGNHGAPYDVLGVHKLDDKQITIRVFRPTAKELYLVNETLKKPKKIAMERVNEHGFYTVTLKGHIEKCKYSLLEINYQDKD